jgi:cytoskeletal protein CcmA (bactofilin family)
MSNPHRNKVDFTMFERNKGKPANTPAPAPTATQPSSNPTTSAPANTRNTAMIGPNITIKGTVSGDEDLLIQGRVEGTISLGQYEVSIGESAEVTANIQAKAVKIDGEVTGDITGTEKVVISKSGNVRGNIVAPRVTLEDGAIFKGSIDMDPGEASAGKVSFATEKKPERPAEATTNKMAPQLDLKSG